MFIAALSLSCSMEKGSLGEENIIEQKRVNLVNEQAPLINEDILKDIVDNTMAPYQPTMEFSRIKMIHIASVDPPPAPGHPLDLQATSFAFIGDSLYGAHIIITYNYWRDTVYGGIEVINIDDLEKPVIVFSKSFPDREFSDIAVDGNYAYAVGNHLQKGAFLQKIDLSNPTQPRMMDMVEFNGYSATSIVLENLIAYIVVGDNLGMLAVDVSGSDFSLVDQVYLLDHATYGLRYLGRTYVLGGSGDFGIHRTRNGRLDFLVPLSGGPATSPARMVFSGDKLYTNAQFSGLSIIDIRGAFATLVSQAPVGGTGNGIAVNGNIALLAQGQKGLLAYDIHDSTDPAYLGYFDFTDDRGSANNLRIKVTKGEIFALLSDGLGGFRILKIVNRLQLSAFQQINPAIHLYDTAMIVKPAYIEIPLTIPVTEGHALSGSAWLKFDSQVTCHYQGHGSSYDFVECSDDSLPGQTLFTTYKIELGMDNDGVSDHPVTVIEVSLQERNL